MGSGEVSLEDRVFLRDRRFDGNLLLVELEVDDAIDQVEAFELYLRATSVRIPEDRFIAWPTSTNFGSDRTLANSSMKRGSRFKVREVRARQK